MSSNCDDAVHIENTHPPLLPILYALLHQSGPITASIRRPRRRLSTQNLSGESATKLGSNNLKTMEGNDFWAERFRQPEGDVNNGVILLSVFFTDAFQPTTDLDPPVPANLDCQKDFSTGSRRRKKKKNKKLKGLCRYRRRRRRAQATSQREICDLRIRVPVVTSSSLRTKVTESNSDFHFIEFVVRDSLKVTDGVYFASTFVQADGREVLVVQNIANKQINKTFAFDKVILRFTFLYDDSFEEDGGSGEVNSGRLWLKGVDSCVARWWFWQGWWRRMANDD
ncbi:hypothetical protein V8G54_002285 [Vigna mungo]|uniref:Uncharacterized protein n=1 Tax=Vigna mungo TaxID=3915 RepID=A0AAQ3P7U3_VIGMU